ncbi:hypothetical protein [Neisseria elongata]|nr:hypothetical protein [Neisseria elongata]
MAATAEKGKRELCRARRQSTRRMRPSENNAGGAFEAGYPKRDADSG